MLGNVRSKQVARGTGVKEPSVKKIEVIMPVIKIRLEEIAALRTLATEGIKCMVQFRTLLRLRNLGLAQEKEIAPCPKEMREYLSKEHKNKRKVEQLLRMKEIDWDALVSLAYQCKRKPTPRTVTLITKEGRKLLATGAAQIQVQRSC